MVEVESSRDFVVLCSTEVVSLLRIESGRSCRGLDQTIHRKGINPTTSLEKWLPNFIIDNIIYRVRVS